MVFSTQTIKSSMNSSLFIKEEKSFYNDKSFFLEMLQYILDESKQINCMINESFSKEIISEGTMSDFLKSSLKKIDPMRIIFKILQGFMDLLDKIWNNFHAFMLNFMNQNSVIKRYKDKLLNIENEVYFPEERYIYTNLGMSTSYTTFKNDLGKEFSNLLLDLSKFNEYKTYEALIVEIERMRNEIDSSESYFDNVRGQILGNRNPVSREDFGGELFKYFRNNGNPISPSNISPNEIKSITAEFLDFNKNLKIINKDKSDMRKEANKLQKDILSVKIENFVKDSIPQEAQRMFITVLENKANRVKLTCDIYLQVFSAKLDASKELYNKYGKILITACKTIVKEEL